VLANQSLPQLPDDLKSAVFGNVGTIVSYRVGKDDAEYLSKHFEEWPKKFPGIESAPIYGTVSVSRQ
jgi:hypothetical protein